MVIFHSYVNLPEGKSIIYMAIFAMVPRFAEALEKVPNPPPAPIYAARWHCWLGGFQMTFDVKIISEKPSEIYGFQKLLWKAIWKAIEVKIYCLKNGFQSISNIWVS